LAPLYSISRGSIRDQERKWRGTPLCRLVLKLKGVCWGIHDGLRVLKVNPVDKPARRRKLVSGDLNLSIGEDGIFDGIRP